MEVRSEPQVGSYFLFGFGGWRVTGRRAGDCWLLSALDSSQGCRGPWDGCRGPTDAGDQGMQEPLDGCRESRDAGDQEMLETRGCRDH